MNVHVGTGASLTSLKKAGTFDAPLSELSLKNVENVDGKLKCSLTDGQDSIRAVITSQVAKANPTLAETSKVRVTAAIYNDDGENAVLMVTGLDHLESGAAPSAAVKAEPIPKAEDIKTPASQTRRPEAAIKTPLSAAQPISSLNPYLHCWTIKAKVLSKGPKREFGKNKPNLNGQSNSVFSAELVDEEGTAIEATFWREAADRYHELLEEGKVYSFSRGSVKVANKNYNRTRNDYCLNFDAACSVQESADVIDANAMQTRMQFEKIDQLPVFVDKKAPVDIIGVVTGVGATGSIKRKSDQQEVVRREVTLADDSLKTVSLTLWGEKAESEGEKLNAMLQAGRNPVLAVSACRVGSYNGVTLSTSMRSNVMIDPDVSEALELKTWYETSGATSTMSAVGEGLAAAKAAGAAKKRYFDLAEIQAKAPDSEDAKPFYATVNAVVASINPDQKMYYLACAENNRKVVEQGPNEFYCEYDGKTYPTAVRRYVANAKVMDSSGMINASLFDEQATAVFGKTADRLHELREETGEQYKVALNGATWQEWSFRIKAFASMWEGNLRKKYAVIDAKPVNFVAETRRILSALNELQ